MTPGDRRAILLGLLAVAGLWVAVRGVPRLVVALGAARERLTLQSALLAETRRMVRDLPLMEDSARLLTAGVAGLAPRLLSGQTGEQALGDLAARLGTVAGRHHARLVGVEPVPDTVRAGHLRSVTGRVRLESDFRGTAEVLVAMVRDTVVLYPERLVLRAPEAGQGRDAPERLEVELIVKGWYLPAEAAP